MRNLIIVAAVIFTIAMLAPELRPLLLVGAFCTTGGFMVGSRQTAQHTAELHAARAERTPAIRHGIGEVSQ
jgi:hypothetical protein